MAFSDKETSNISVAMILNNSGRSLEIVPYEGEYFPFAFLYAIDKMCPSNATLLVSVILLSSCFTELKSFLIDHFLFAGS